MTNHNWWLDKAKQLPTLGKARIEHDCGSGRAAIINNGPKGYSFYCHRCGDTFFVHHGQRTFKELMQLRKINEQDALAIRGSMKLPDDYSLDIPPEAMLWLLKASVTPYMARQARIGWSKRYQRVILPVYNDDNLVFYQARAIHEHQDIKYLNPSVDRSSILFWQLPKNFNGNKDVIVLTEDILSAVRVGEQIPTVSLLGTKISDQQAEQIAHYKHAITWLDPDQAGISGAKSVRNTLNLVMQTSNICTKKDPKLLTYNEIQHQVKAHICSENSGN